MRPRTRVGSVAPRDFARWRRRIVSRPAGVAPNPPLSPPHGSGVLAAADISGSAPRAVGPLEPTTPGDHPLEPAFPEVGLPAVGDRVSLVATMSSMLDYEFDAF